MACRRAGRLTCSLDALSTFIPCKAQDCLRIADDMHEDERQLWTEQILQWMCSSDPSTEIRFACGQALTGTCSLSLLAMFTCAGVICSAGVMLPNLFQNCRLFCSDIEPICRASICVWYRRPTDRSQVACRSAGVLLQGCDGIQCSQAGKHPTASARTLQSTLHVPASHNIPAACGLMLSPPLPARW